MKKMALVFLFSLFVFSSCMNKDTNYYQKGYQDAWDGNRDIFLYFLNQDYKKGQLDARSQIRDYKNFQNTMNQTKHELGKAADQASASVDNLRQKVEEWGKEK